jgi:hypothetical protein
MIEFFLGAGVVGWLAGESIRRGRRVGDSRLGSGERLGQEYVTDEELIEAQSAYEALVRDPSASAKDISEHYSLYRELYAQYQSELPLREQLERMAWDLDRDALDATMSQIPETRAAAERRMKDRLARMEELWPGWYKRHLDWEVYRRTGGKPDWYIELESSALSAINLAIQLVPFFQGMRGGVRAPGVRVPGVRVPTPSIRQPGIVIPPKGPEAIYPFRPGDPLQRPFVVPTPSAAPAPALLKPAPLHAEMPPWLAQFPPEIRNRFLNWSQKAGIRAEKLYDPKEASMWTDIVSKYAASKGFPVPPVPTRPLPSWTKDLPSNVVDHFFKWAESKGISWRELSHPGSENLWKDIARTEAAKAGLIPPLGPTVPIPKPTPTKPFLPSPAGPQPVYPLPIAPARPTVVPEGPFRPIPTGGERRYQWGPTPLSQVIPPTTPTQRTVRLPGIPGGMATGGGGAIPFTGV